MKINRLIIVKGRHNIALLQFSCGFSLKQNLLTFLTLIVLIICQLPLMGLLLLLFLLFFLLKWTKNLLN